MGPFPGATLSPSPKSHSVVAIELPEVEGLINEVFVNVTGAFSHAVPMVRPGTIVGRIVTSTSSKLLQVDAGFVYVYRSLYDPGFRREGLSTVVPKAGFVPVNAEPAEPDHVPFAADVAGIIAWSV